MPRFKVSDPETGLTATLEGDSPPTEQELVEVFGVLDKKIRPSAQATTPPPGQQTQPVAPVEGFAGVPQAFPAAEQRQVDLTAQAAARQPPLPSLGQVDITAAARQEPESPEAEIQPIGKPGTLLYGASEVAASVLNRPEYLAAMLNPATAAAVGLRYAPGVAKQFVEDLGKASQGDDQALGRAAMIGIPALVGAVRGGRSITQRMAAQTALERARSASAASSIDALSRLELTPPTMLKRSEAELSKIPGERTTDASKVSETTEVHGDVRPLPVQGEGEVPVKESGAGVQPQTERGLPEARPDDTGAATTKKAVLGDVAATPPEATPELAVARLTYPETTRGEPTVADLSKEESTAALQESKPPPIKPEAAPPTEAPTTAAVSAAKEGVGETAPSPSAISEATTKPESSQVNRKIPIIQIEGRIYQGITHADAYNKALKAGEKLEASPDAIAKAEALGIELPKPNWEGGWLVNGKPVFGEGEAPIPETTVWHQTAPENAPSIRSEGYRESKTGFLGPGVYVATTPKIISSKLVGKPAVTMESTVTGKLLKISGDAPNVPLEILRQLMGDEEGGRFYDAHHNEVWSETTPNWKYLRKLAEDRGYSGYSQSDVGYDRVLVFDPKNVKPKPLGGTEVKPAEESPQVVAGRDILKTIDSAEAAIEESIQSGDLPSKGTELPLKALQRLRKRVEQAKQEGVLGEPEPAKPAAELPAKPIVRWLPRIGGKGLGDIYDAQGRIVASEVSEHQATQWASKNGRDLISGAIVGTTDEPLGGTGTQPTGLESIPENTEPIPELRAFEYHPGDFQRGLPVYSHPGARSELARRFGIPNEVGYGPPGSKENYRLFVNKQGRPIALWRERQTSPEPLGGTEAKTTVEPTPTPPAQVEGGGALPSVRKFTASEERARQSGKQRRGGMDYGFAMGEAASSSLGEMSRERLIEIRDALEWFVGTKFERPPDPKADMLANRMGTVALLEKVNRQLAKFIDVEATVEPSGKLLAQGEGGGAPKSGSAPSSHHVAIYGGKEVSVDYVADPKREFRVAAQRVRDNLNPGEKGYVRTPSGMLYEISRESKMAKPVAPEKVEGEGAPDPIAQIDKELAAPYATDAIKFGLNKKKSAIQQGKSDGSLFVPYQNSRIGSRKWAVVEVATGGDKEFPVTFDHPELGKVNTGQLFFKTKTEAQRAIDALPKSEPPPASDIVGMGGAVPTEFAPGGAAGMDIYGIAERVREQRAKAGQTLPVESGEGISAPDSVERGRELLRGGADAEASMTAFERTKKLSADDMALARAKGEALFQQARQIESKFGTESQEYLDAFKRASDWDKRSKAMQTEWHKMGQAQQGETDIDTGTFTGLQRAFGEEFTAKQAKVAKEHVAKVQKAEAEAAEAKAKLTETLKALEKAQAEKPKISSYVLKVAERWVAEWGKEAEKARKALAGKFLSPSPEDLLNLAKIARYDIAQIGLDFAKWTEKMVREFGPKVQPYLADAWAKGQELIEGKVKQVKDKEVGQQIKRQITKEPDPVVDLWKRAKAMIDGGETDPQAVFTKLATETGRPVGEVRELLTKPKTVKKVSDEMYLKMAQRRRVISAAKAWVKNEKTPGWLRFMRSVPRIFFIDKIFGHGTVGMITHAGLNIFNPSAWRTYWPAFIKQYGLVFKPAYHERMMQDLMADPLYVKARRAGLANDPYRYADDYQNAVMQTFMNSKLGRLAGGEGFDALKLFRQARFNQLWNALPDTLKTDAMARMIADATNHATGIVNSRFPEWSGWAFFAPKLEASRWAWAVKDSAKAGEIISRWKKATPEERRFAMTEVREKATIAGFYFGLLALNQGLLSATGSKEQINFTNPRRGDFLAFKIAGHKVGVVGPMLGMVRLLAELVHESMGQRTSFEKLRPRASEMGSTVFSYARGKLSPFAGQVGNVMSQADFQGRPLPWSSDEAPNWLIKRGQGKYTYPEYFAQEFTPIPVSEAIREVWADQGMNENAIATAMKALTIGIVAGGTGARITKDFTPTPSTAK